MAGHDAILYTAVETPHHHLIVLLQEPQEILQQQVFGEHT